MAMMISCQCPVEGHCAIIASLNVLIQWHCFFWLFLPIKYVKKMILRIVLINCCFLFWFVRSLIWNILLKICPRCQAIGKPFQKNLMMTSKPAYEMCLAFFQDNHSEDFPTYTPHKHYHALKSNHLDRNSWLGSWLFLWSGEQVGCVQAKQKLYAATIWIMQISRQFLACACWDCGSKTDNA